MAKDYNVKEMAEKVASLKQGANELKLMAGGLQAVERNVDRILASIKMLEINVSDIVDIL